KPYVWDGPYASYRDSSRARHDAGLCADVRAAWMEGGDRIIVRSCEIVGYATGFLYDDHLPASEPEGRGEKYRHIPFQWDAEKSRVALSADCVVPSKGKFWIRLQAKSDFIDIELGIR